MRTQTLSADLKLGLHEMTPHSRKPLTQEASSAPYFVSLSEIPILLTICIPAVRDLLGEQAPLIGGWLFKEFAGENCRQGCEQNPPPSGFSLFKKTTHTGLPTSNQKTATASPGGY